MVIYYISQFTANFILLSTLLYYLLVIKINQYILSTIIFIQKITLFYSHINKYICSYRFYNIPNIVWNYHAKNIKNIIILSCMCINLLYRIFYL